MRNKTLETLLALLVVSLIATGCATTTPPPSRVSGNFDFIPQETNAPGSAGITFGILDPTYDDGRSQFNQGSNYGARYLSKFTDSMSGDFYELLNAKGYVVKGPYPSHDEMTFPDKQGSDLLLSATIKIDNELLDFNEVPMLSLSLLTTTASTAETRGRYTGNVRVNARITMKITESVTDQLMWTKSIQLPEETLSVTTTQSYYRNELNMNSLMEKEASFYNEMIRKVLEPLYDNVLSSVDQFLHVEEMREINSQAKQVRERARVAF